MHLVQLITENSELLPTTFLNSEHGHLPELLTDWCHSHLRYNNSCGPTASSNHALIHNRVSQNNTSLTRSIKHLTTIPAWPWALIQYRTPSLFLIMTGRSFLKRAPNHKPPIQVQMLAAWYYISFLLVHGISLIEIGAHFKNDLPAIIRNKEGGGGGGSDTVRSCPILMIAFFTKSIFVITAGPSI